MKLYNKFLIGGSLIAVIFIIIILFFSNNILLSNYEKIEDNSIISNMERANNAMNEEIDKLSDFVNDYSAWNDSYTFIKDKNKEYLYSNFSRYTSFKRFRINFIIYTDKDGKVILSKSFNLNSNKEEPLSEKAEREIILKAQGLSVIKHSESIKGVTEINNIPIILATEPITTTDGRKASGGHIIAGRYLDAKQISLLSSRVKVDLSMEKYNKKTELHKNIRWINNIAIENVNKDSVISYKILADIENNPYLVIKINVVREIYRQAVKSITYFVIIVILISLSFLGIVLIYLNKAVAKRIMRMNTIIYNIRDTKDLTMRIKENGNDEIASLAAGFNNMIDELGKYSDKILELANQDMLTGLPNRKMIMDNIKSTICKMRKHGGKFAILFIDLDDFKRVNDSLGHDAGDALIQNVGYGLKNIISSEDVVARIGGDEFIILQKDIMNSVSEAENLAIRIRNVLKESFIHRGNELNTAVSIGISIYPDDGVDIPSLIKKSDIAMYEAKKNGGNCYRVYSKNINKVGLINLIL